MIPRGVRSKDMIGMKVRTTREIRNKAGICIPKGTIVKIVGFGRCFSIETKKCTKCGLSAYIRNITRNDVEFIEIDEKITNADRIRNMTDEELADFLLKVNAAYSEPCMTGETDCNL